MTARGDLHDNRPISRENVGLKKGSLGRPAGAATAVHIELHVEFKNRHTKNSCMSDEDVTSRDAKPPVKRIAMNKLSTMLDAFLGDILRPSFDKAQSGIRSVV